MFLYVSNSAFDGGPSGRHPQDALTAVEIDPVSGRMGLVQTIDRMTSPCYMAMHPRSSTLYVLERYEPEGGDAFVSPLSERKSGYLTAFSIAGDGSLEQVSRTRTGGESPVHLSLTPDAEFALVANPGRPPDPDPEVGHVTVLQIEPGGAVRGLVGSVKWDGPPPVWRQARPKAYPHSVFLDPAGARAFVPQLMTDLVVIYNFDATTGLLTPAFQPHVQVSTGSGPRHLAFHPSGKAFYIVNSRNATISVASYDPESGLSAVIQTVSNHPQGFNGPRKSPHAVVSPDGRFLYCANTGHHSIGIFAIDQDTCELEPVGRLATGGRSPRDFTLSADGTLMVVANRGSDEVISCHVDTESGQLTPSGSFLSMYAPNCVVLTGSTSA